MDAGRTKIRSDAAPPGYERIACPMCGGSESVVALRGGDHILKQPIELTIVRCVNCALCYLNPRPTPDRLGEYYPSNYHAYREQKGDVVGDRASTRVRKLVLRRLFAPRESRPRGVAGLLADTLVALRGRGHFGDGLPVQGAGRLLDFGCGAGKLLRSMKVAGWDVVGLDFSEQAVQAVRAGGLEAHQGTLPHPAIAPVSFDAVTMQHALEHVPDPRAVLRAARDVLRPGGEIFVNVPNFDSWEVLRFGDAAVQVDLPRHLIHFEPMTLSRMLESAGFANVRVTARPKRGFVRQSIVAARARGQPVPGWMNLKSVHQFICRRNRRNGIGGELVAIGGRPG